MAEQHPQDFPKQEHASMHNQRAYANADDPSEHVSCQQAPLFDYPPEPFYGFNLTSNDYSCADDSETFDKCQNVFQPLDLDPQHQMYGYSGTYSSNIYAPAEGFTSLTPGQPWIDEIHPSYTPDWGGNFNWASSDSSAYGWVVDNSFTQTANHTLPMRTPSTLLLDQYPSLEISTPESLVLQHSMPNTKPLLPMQQSFSRRRGLTNPKCRKSNFRKEIATLQHELSGHDGHKAMRVSKTKRAKKTDNNVKHEACWRCKRYRKACIGQDICKECSTAGFRVWPSSIGCRRGAMEGFVEKIMPSHSIEVLKNMRIGDSRISNWRKALYQVDHVSLSPNGTNDASRWDLLKYKVHSTMIFGPEFSALVDVLAAYEQAQSTEVAIWTQSIILLSSTCDFYHFFIASSNTEIELPRLISNTIKFRKSLATSWDMFLKLCLSGKKENWFPAFLSVILGICSMVILMDAVPSVPGPTRQAIWADVEGIVRDLRVRQYMMSLDLLRIGAKGSNPLKLNCWGAEEDINAEGQDALKRNSKGMALLGQDSAAFDGFIALQEWHSRYKAAMLRGNDMWDSVPFTKSHIQAITALSRVFEF